MNFLCWIQTDYFDWKDINEDSFLYSECSTCSENFGLDLIENQNGPNTIEISEKIAIAFTVLAGTNFSC